MCEPLHIADNLFYGAAILVAAARPEEEGREGICDGFTRARDCSRPPVTGVSRHDRPQENPQHRPQPARSLAHQCPQNPGHGGRGHGARSQHPRARHQTNLVVHPTPIDNKGVYEVDAGGRRLKILQKLAAEGVIDADHPVPCKIESADEALETSLVENTIRAAMHPADEFVPSRRRSGNRALADIVAAGDLAHPF
jgi:hypothetical protein